MALFLDSSALVKRYVTEPGTPVIVDMLTRPEFRGGLFVAEHAEVEVVSALAKKVRERRIRRSDFSAAVLNFRGDYPAIFTVVPIAGLTWDAAERIVRNPERGLRAADALHLAAAKYVALNALPATDPLIMVSADYRLLEAAWREGLRVLHPERHPRPTLPGL